MVRFTTRRVIKDKHGAIRRHIFTIVFGIIREIIRVPGRLRRRCLGCRHTRSRSTRDHKHRRLRGRTLLHQTLSFLKCLVLQQLVGLLIEL